MARRPFTILATGLVLLCACAGDELPPRPLPSTTPNIILIVLDTVRPDHLGSYGYERKTSPHFDSLSGEATLYTRAMAAAPWTVPTHASLFTGLYPFEHGAHTYKPYTTQGIVHPLSKSNLTLAEILRMGGYRTAAFVANSGYLHPFFQLDQGFESYFHERMYADKLNERVFEWLEERDEIPFFLFINFMDTHRPYNTAERPGFIDPPAEQGGDALLSELATIVLRGEEPFPAELARKVIDQYDTAIANLDESMGALMERLRTLGIYDRSLIIITSDHGEYFGEHQLVEHSKDVYQEALWVPLVVKAPNQRSAERSDALISSVHMPRLILSHTPQEVFGRFLALYPEAKDEPVIAENYYARGAHLFAPRFGHRFFRVRTAFFDWPYKYIHSTDGNDELYDLDADPAEAENLVQIDVETAASLARELAEFKERRLSRVKFLREEDLVDEDDPELQERLRALGYVASSRTGHDASGERGREVSSSSREVRQAPAREDSE